MGLGRLFGRKAKAEPGSPATQSLHRVSETEAKRFLGRAMHAYPLSKVKGNACPRCGGALEQHRCSVAYMGAEEAASVETTDTWFCSSCKSAVLDEKAIKRQVRDSGDKYMAALGLDVGKEDPAFFESWDGEGDDAAGGSGSADASDSDDDQMAKMMRAMFGLGDSGAEEAPAPGTVAKRKQRKSKRKQSNQARKKNRRKH
jgi:hypothetical protein